jgi:hypothetical protein
MKNNSTQLPAGFLDVCSKALMVLSLALFSFSKINAQNRALEFNGTTMVDAGNSSLFDATTIRTMEAWVRFEDLNGAREILSKSMNSSGIELLLINNTLAFYCMYNASNAALITYPTSNLRTGAWYHLAVSWDGLTKESMRLYVNGVSVGSAVQGNGNINTTGITNPGTFRIGQWSQVGDPRFFFGYIDEVRVWNVVRSADDLKKGMYGTVSSSSSGLVAYYNFNHTSGSVLANSTPNAGLNGTVTSSSIVWFSSPVQFDHNALAFDGGDDYLHIPAKTDYDFSTGTIEFIARPRSFSAGINHCILGLRSDGGRLSVHMTATALGIWNGSVYETKAYSFTPGTWYHIALVANAGVITPYVNGVAAATPYTAGMGTATGHPLMIGKVKGTVADMEPFPGDVDEVRIWNTARTSTQINTYKDVTLLGNEAGLVGLFSFDQGNPTNNNAALTNVIDKTSANNHGILVNSALTGGSSNFIISSILTLLPVHLSSFEAAKKNGQSALSWKTSSEQSSKTFVVERSSNGSDYTSIGSVEAAGKSSTEKMYSFTDISPLSGKNFYRLKMVDIDARSSYSAIRVLDFSTSDKLYWYANDKTIEVRLQNGGSELYQLTDINGRTVKSGKLSNGRQSFYNLPTGTYNLQVQGKELQAIRFIVR